jgi:hypothetical protein
VDRDGTIVAHKIGEIDQAELDEAIRKTLS